MLDQSTIKTNTMYHPIFESSSKLLQLRTILASLLQDGLIIAFSGGVDSSFLLWAAIKTLKHMQSQSQQGRLLALLAVSPSVPTWEIEEAKKFAAELDVALIVRNSDELNQEAYAKNDQKRCYYCKSELFKIAKQEAEQKGYRHVAYGYNASDRKDTRFGHISAEENQIHAPLDTAGLEKEDIRKALREIGLNLADKPASPCLASRIMTGVRVTQEKLQHIQKMEDILRNANLRIYRVRVHEEPIVRDGITVTLRYFRIEVAPEEMLKVLQLREVLVHEAHTMGYRWVNLDLAGYQLGGGTVTS